VFYQQKITVSQISFLVAYQYLIQVLGELPSGAMADLLGKRATIVIGFLIGSISFLLFPFAQTFTHFFWLATLVGISDSFLSGSVEALVYDSQKQDGLESQFSKVQATHSFWYQIGLACSTVMGGYLFVLNRSIPYVLYGLSLFFATILSFFYIEPKIDSAKFTLKNYLKQIKDGVKELFKNEHTKRISWFYIWVGAITWSTQLFFKGVMLIELGFSDQERGIIEGVLRLLNVVLIASVFKKSHFFTKERTVWLFPIIMLAAYMPGMFTQGIGGIPLIAGVMFASTARWILLSKYTNEAYDSKYRATAISTLSMLIGVIYIAITVISGPIMEHFGGAKMMYSLLGLLSLITVVPLAMKITSRKNSVLA
jgi:MFS family permease